MKISSFIRKNAVFISGGIIIIAGVLVYANSFSGAFVFDDIKAIVTNPHIREILPLSESLSGPWDSAVRDRPVVCFTLAINYALGDLEVRGYHAFNLVIHILAGLALFGIVRRTFLSRVLAARYTRSATSLALAAALLWIVHPFQTESVTYIIQRSESLAGLFYLLTLYCFIRGASSSFRWGWFGGSILFCALGMGAKSVMVTAPLMVLIYDVVFNSRSLGRAVKNHWVLYLSLAATWLIQALIIYRTSYDDLKGLSPVAYLLTQPGVISHFIRLSFWPHPLCLDYGWPLARSIGDVLPPAIFIGALLWGLIWALIKKPALGFLGVWFFLILIPTSSILPLEDPAFEHRFYLPLAAITTLVVVIAAALLRQIRSPGRRILIASSLLVAVTAALSYLTITRNQLYQDPMALWRDIATRRPDHARGHYNFGLELSKTGQRDTAIEEYRAAVKLKPDYADAHNNLGAALVEEGNTLEAIRHYGQALRAKPDFWEARYNLGVALANLQKEREALICFREVLRIQPSFAPAHHRAAESLWIMDQLDQALPYYREAIRLNPAYREMLYNRGVEQANQGNPETAHYIFQTILSVYPDYRPALQAIQVLVESEEDPASSK